MARVTIDEYRCKGCGMCVAHCPKKILVIDAGSINQNGYNPVRCTQQELCIGCAMCARMCPDVCITVEK